MMNRWLVQVGLWLAKLGGWMPPSPEPMLSTARDLVREQQARWPERDSEAKRAAVYRALVNTYPAASKRELSRAIEEAVCLDC